MVTPRMEQSSNMNGMAERERMVLRIIGFSHLKCRAVAEKQPSLLMECAFAQINNVTTCSPCNGRARKQTN
jgi:hypothetical protein